MKGERVFITGGAGFIGSRLASALMKEGAEVVAYDILHPQVHGNNPSTDFPMTLIRGDVSDRELLSKSINDFLPTIVIHLAAETGTGQSADEPCRYTQVNIVGTANLIEVMRAASKPPKRVVLAATRAVYGEGAYEDANGQLVVPEPRTTEAMANGVFDVLDDDGNPLKLIATPENIKLVPGSVYGSTKLMQEYLLQQCPAPWDSVMLRLQNVYGPGQSLRNPYTGVLSIFCQQALRGETLNIFEDGVIYRDFVYIDDVVNAFVVACQVAEAGGQIINIGTGKFVSIQDTAEIILQNLGFPKDKYNVTGDYRAGDIRHAIADISIATNLLGWSAQTTIEEGIKALASWAANSPEEARVTQV